MLHRANLAHALANKAARLHGHRARNRTSGPADCGAFFHRVVRRRAGAPLNALEGSLSLAQQKPRSAAVDARTFVAAPSAIGSKGKLPPAASFIAIVQIPSCVYRRRSGCKPDSMELTLRLSLGPARPTRRFPPAFWMRKSSRRFTIVNGGVSDPLACQALRAPLRALRHSALHDQPTSARSVQASPKSPAVSPAHGRQGRTPRPPPAAGSGSGSVSG